MIVKAKYEIKDGLKAQGLRASSLCCALCLLLLLLFLHVLGIYYISYLMGVRAAAAEQQKRSGKEGREEGRREGREAAESSPPLRRRRNRAGHKGRVMGPPARASIHHREGAVVRRSPFDALLKSCTFSLHSGALLRAAL